MAKRFLFLITLLLLGFYIAGCSEGDSSDSVTNPNPNVFKPTGSISGVVFDSCAQKPVQGAVVSVAYAGKVRQVTTSANGAFSFANVPANYQWQETGYGYGGYWDQEMGSDDGYYVTCDLTKVTGYGFAIVEEVWVYFGDLGDGDNFYLAFNNEQTESGSGADTPVDGLSAGLNFEVSSLNASISGKIYDVSTGRALVGGSVSLYYGGNFMATTTVTANGEYTFDNVMPSCEGYSLLVSVAGWEYAALQEPNTVSGVSCGRISLSCSVGCNQDLKDVNVNLIANPAKDKTVPYIVSVAGGGQSDIITGDDFPSLAYDDITNLVLTFSEGMADDRTVKNAVGLASSFAVTVTSGGTHTGPGTKPDPITRSIAIIDSYTVTMTSTGVMTVAITYLDEDALAAAAIASYNIAFNPDLTWDSDEATAAVGIGSYTLTLTPSTHLTDASYIPWYANEGRIGNTGNTAGQLDFGFLHAFAEAYQDYFILNTAPANGVGTMTITVGE